MPLLRKLIKIGRSKGVTLPKSWIDYYEHQKGYKITKLEMETDGEVIILKIPKRAQKTEAK